MIARLGAQIPVALSSSFRLTQVTSRRARERTRRGLASRCDVSHLKVSK